MIDTNILAAACPACPEGLLFAELGWLICDHCGFTASLMDAFYLVHPPTERADSGPLLNPTRPH